jgi:RNA polymerase sigma factor for flagellar operon FliA
VGAARDKLRHEKGLEPSSEDVAQELGTTPEHVEETMSQLQMAQVLSLDDYLLPEDRSEGRKLDVMAGDAARTPEDNLQQSEKQEILVDAILKLPEQQQKVLNLYYYEELTLKEIGAVLEVSESRICQIHGAAVKTLRKAVQGGL